MVKNSAVHFMAQREADGERATELSKSDAGRGAGAPATGRGIIHDVLHKNLISEHKNKN